MTEKPTELQKAMYLAARDLLGRGYIPEYYEQAAADFIAIAREFGAKEKPEKVKV